MIKQKLLGGMIGAGAWSSLQLNAWKKVQGAEIISICDRHPEKLSRLIYKYNIQHTFNSFEDMVNDPEIDFFDICTRPYSHANLINIARKRGKPILCQKPFCTSLEEAKKVVNWCKTDGIRLMINENYRWQSTFRKAKEILNNKLLGKPFYAKIYSHISLTHPKFDLTKANDQAYLADMPQLILYELGIHFLDTFRFLFGEPKSVYANLHKVSQKVKGEDVQIIILNYKDLTCIADLSWASFPLIKNKQELPFLQIEGDLGTLYFARNGQLYLNTEFKKYHWNMSNTRNIKSRDLYAAIATQQHFINSIKKGNDFETSGEDYINTMRLVYSCYKSSRTNKVISL